MEQLVKARAGRLRAFREAEQDLDLANADLEDALQVVEDVEGGGLRALWQTVTLRAGRAAGDAEAAKAAQAEVQARYDEAAHALEAVERDLAAARFRAEVLADVPDALAAEADAELGLLASLEAEIAMVLNAVAWAERVLLAIHEDVDDATRWSGLRGGASRGSVAQVQALMEPARRAVARVQEAVGRLPGDLVEMVGDDLRHMERGFRKDRSVLEHVFRPASEAANLEDVARAGSMAVEVAQNLQRVRKIVGERQVLNRDAAAALRDRLLAQNAR